MVTIRCLAGKLDKKNKTSHKWDWCKKIFSYIPHVVGSFLFFSKVKKDALFCFIRMHNKPCFVRNEYLLILNFNSWLLISLNKFSKGNSVNFKYTYPCCCSGNGIATTISPSITSTGSVCKYSYFFEYLNFF